MNYIIDNKLNPELEAYLLLESIINDNNPNTQRESLKKDSSPKSLEMLTLLELPTLLYNTIKEKISNDLDRLTFFFKSWENPNLSLAGLLFASTLDLSFEERLHKLHTSSKEEQFDFLKKCVLSYLYELSPDSALSSTSIETEKELFNCIESTKELSYEHKYHLVLLYHHFDKLLEEFYDLLLKTVSYLEPYLAKMQEATLPFIENLTQSLETKGLDFFEEEVGVTLDSNKLKIYPTFTGFNKLNLENFQGVGPHDHMFLGIYLFKLVQLRNASLIDEKSLAPFLKAIADPSKLEILKLLKNEKFYASQLAEKLQISNATISHHVSTLMNLELITFEKEQTKIFFALNKEKVHSYLTLLQRVFE